MYQTKNKLTVIFFIFQTGSSTTANIPLSSKSAADSLSTQESPRKTSPRNDSLSEYSQRKEEDSLKKDSPKEDSQTGKIVGGYKVEKGQFPFMVSLRETTGSSNNR
jgi:hypothetical protein